MIEFLIQFLRPFTIINKIVQGTSQASLQDTWVHYEAIFDILDNTNDTLNSLQNTPIWLTEVLDAIDTMWTKLHKYYDRTECPFAYVNATLLHPALKVRFMEKSDYPIETIELYRKEAEERYIKFYDPSSYQPGKANRGKKCAHHNSETNSSSDGYENEFTNFMARRHEKDVKNPLHWWANYSGYFLKLSKMVRDTYSVPVSSAGVEQELVFLEG